MLDDLRGSTDLKDNESVSSLKELVINTTEGRMAILVGAAFLFGTFIWGANRVIEHYFPVNYEVLNQQVTGNSSPDTYIEKDGVRFYSHIDEKSVEDLVE